MLSLFLSIDGVLGIALREWVVHSSLFLAIRAVARSEAAPEDSSSTASAVWK
ncbi:MAG: hypothetical protein QGH59_03285 [Gemmatimonadota bacterium]|nr:hypothetical protein [Gemmatimonadota bacterium]